MTHLLGIDIGTSSVKALVFDADERKSVGVGAQEYPIYMPHVGYAEQDPDDYWQATIKAVRQALAQAGNVRIVGISFSGQMHGTVLLDAHHKPVHRAIIWADGRATNESETLLTKVPYWAQIAGTDPAVGFQIVTLAWLAQHNVPLLKQTHCVILPKDYVRFRMTGEVSTDISDAASTGALNIRTGKWSDELLAAAGVDMPIMPTIHLSAQVVGTLRLEAAIELGLPAGIPVVAGCADQPAQAIGSGLVTPGIGSVTIGTGGQVFVPYRPESTLQTDTRLHVFNHAVPNTWYVLGAILAAGSALGWLRNLTGLQNRADAYETLSYEASQVKVGADGLLFLPYLFGERTPHMDALASGAFFGLRYHHGRGHLARAVMEGVSFALREVLTISLTLGAQVDELVIAGGGAQSKVWRQILTDVLGVPLKRSQHSEQASLGAAILAGVGVGVYPDVATACASISAYDTPNQPNTDAKTRYDDLFVTYQNLYPTLKETMHSLAR